MARGSPPWGAQHAAKWRAVVAVEHLAHVALHGRLQIDPKLRMDTASSQDHHRM